MPRCPSASTKSLSSTPASSAPSGPVTLETAQKGRADFALAVGRIENTVTVEATTPQISTEDSSVGVGTVVDNTYVSRFPLFLRSWDDLLGLVAGVQGNRYTEQSGVTSAGRTGGFNVHGVQSLQNNFLLDGVDNNSISENVQELTTQVVRPSVDTIQEFKIITIFATAWCGAMYGNCLSEKANRWLPAARWRGLLVASRLPARSRTPAGVHSR